ncbi:MAG: ribonuclease J [Chthonomonas sp.]|nr:ribonuclease J [Chthonomonas sp.]
MSTVKIVPIGGAGEIGKNCTLVIQGDDMVMVDCGLSFPNEEQYGVDIVIPDFSYVLEHKEKLRGIFLTHAHEDHVGALPYLLPHVDCPVFATELTHAMIRNKLEEKIDVKRLKLVPMKPGDKVEVGAFKVESIRITHSYPESTSIAVNTVHGHVLFTGDFKFDFTPVDGKLSDISRLTKLGDEGIVCLVSDSTNVERPGWGPSETLVAEGLREVYRRAQGRVLITTFASNIHRMQQAFEVAAETGRKVAIAGRRMEQTVDICSRMGYMKIPRNTFIKLDEVTQHDPNKIVILTTGSQGEPMSALVQMSKETYSRLRIREGDTLIYSARPIPGNESAIWRTVNRLFRMGVEVVYDSPHPIHVSGHAYQEELKMMINITRPYYLCPVHGEPRHQFIYRKMALGMGYPDHRVFTLEDGIPLDIQETSANLGEPVPCGRVLVDNGGNPGVTDEVLRDRQNLANDGTVVLTIALDMEAGEIVGDLSVQARGFSGPESAIQKAGAAVVDTLDQLSTKDIKDPDIVRHAMADTMRRILHRQSQMRPLVLPVIVEI